MIVTKIELLERLSRKYACFQDALERLTPEQMVVPRTIRESSVRDLLAHLIAHEQRALQEVRAAARGARLAVDHAAGDSFNAGAVAASLHYSIDAVRAAWRSSFDEVVATVSALPDAYFDPSHPITVVLDDTIDGALANNTYDHYVEHIPDIELAIEHFR